MPTTTPVAPDGAELLDAVRHTLRRYCVLPGLHAYTVITLFIAYTHGAAVFDFAPRLVQTSPEKRSGKTRCLELIALLSHEPFQTANASTAALCRSLDDPRTVLRRQRAMAPSCESTVASDPTWATS